MFTSEIQQKNEELRQSEERYHKMISEVQDYAILLLNKEGRIQNWNSGAEVIKGYSEEEIMGQNFRIFYTPEAIDVNLPDRVHTRSLMYFNACIHRKSPKEQVSVCLS